MKALKIIAVVMLLSTSCVVHRTVVEAQGPAQSYQVFYDNLSPYGQWVVYGNYGYVWVPNCGPDFMPYSTMGYWVYSDYGWTWCSEYPWGWAPFHYGTWGYDSFYGWYWVPGHVWGPAWVMWREYPGYYGWAPLGPDYIVGVTVYSHYYIPPHYWLFVDHRHFCDHDLHQYYGPRDHYDNYVKNSTVISYYTGKGTNTLYTGPKPKQVSQYTGSAITPVSISQRSDPGQSSVSGNKFNIYRPSISQTPTNKVQPAPGKVYEKKDVAPINQRPAYNPQAQPQPKVQPQQPKQEPQAQPQPKVQPQQPKQEPRTQPKVQPKQEPRTQPRTQPRNEPRTQPRTQPRNEPRTQPRTQPRIQSQPHSQTHSGGRRVGPAQPSNKGKKQVPAKTDEGKSEQK